ncbi:hypothetical protein [Kitasatospora sp. NPDC059327]|uniref:hypothetical protein n=1 Tax=Kitasatospora sp. NPDC059327 TaxID=3346803 RepID=UPI003683E9A2
MTSIAEYQHGNGLIFGAVAIVVAWSVVAGAFAIHVQHVAHCDAPDGSVEFTFSTRNEHHALTVLGSLAAVVGASFTGHLVMEDYGGWATLFGWLPWISLATGGLYFHLVHQKR